MPETERIKESNHVNQKFEWFRENNQLNINNLEYQNLASEDLAEMFEALFLKKK